MPSYLKTTSGLRRHWPKVVAISFFLLIFLFAFLPAKNVEDIVLGYVINTEGCRIPIIKFFDIGPPSVVEPCGGNAHRLQTVIQYTATDVWIDHSRLKGNWRNGTLNCSYCSFQRAPPQRYGSPIAVNYKCIKFTDTMAVRQDEFVRVTCTAHDTVVDEALLLFAPRKPPPAPKAAANSTAYNVIVLGIDSVSRLNFHRKMPRTSAVLHQLGAVELLGYNTLGYHSINSLAPLLTGRAFHTNEDEDLLENEISNLSDRGPLIWEEYKNAGFYTASAEDNALGIGFTRAATEEFLDTPTDYFTQPFMYELYQHYNGRVAYCHLACWRGKRTFQVLLQYIEQLTSSLRFDKLFGYFWSLSATHNTSKETSLLDVEYASLLARWNATGYLQHTALLLLSDHGTRFDNSVPYPYGKLDLKLPFASVLVPKSFRTKYGVAYNNLQLNSRRLVTAFDLHETLSDLVEPQGRLADEVTRTRKVWDTPGPGISVFAAIPLNRTCQSAGVDGRWCACHLQYDSARVPLDSAEVRNATATAMDVVNKDLQDAKECAQFVITRILTAEVIRLTSPMRSLLSISWEASPGGAVFMTTLARRNGSWRRHGPVDRLNLYGPQSICIDESKPKLRPYCVCAGSPPSG